MSTQSILKQFRKLFHSFIIGGMGIEIESFLAKAIEGVREEERKSIIKLVRDISIKPAKIDYDSFMSNKLEINAVARQITYYVWKDILRQIKSFKKGE